MCECVYVCVCVRTYITRFYCPGNLSPPSSPIAIVNKNPHWVNDPTTLCDEEVVETCAKTFRARSPLLFSDGLSGWVTGTHLQRLVQIVYIRGKRNVFICFCTHTHIYIYVHTYTLWIIQNVRVVARAKSHQLARRALSSDPYSPLPPPPQPILLRHTRCTCLWRFVLIGFRQARPTEIVASAKFT